jgi:hypothetical protein
MYMPTKLERIAMKVLIQNPLTLSYLQNLGTWTSDPEKAYSFRDSRSAIQFCLHNDMEDMQVVLKGEDDRFDVQVPVGLQPSLGAVAQAW